jgi:hypothetical protein
MNLHGLPDLDAPLDPAGEPDTVFAAFGRPDRAVVLPTRIGIERQVDGSPALLLTLVRRGDHDGGGPDAGGHGGGNDGGNDGGGRLEVGFAVEADLAAVGTRLAAGGVPARPATAELAGGVLELTTTVGAAGPNALVEPIVLDPDVLTRARVIVELSPAAASVAVRLITDATLPVSAVLRLSVRAVGPRLPVAVQFDPRRVAELLAQRFGPAAVLDEDELADAVDGLLTTPAFTVDGDRGAVRARVLGQRVGARLAAPQPVAARRYRLRPVAELPSGRERIDFAEPAAITVHRVLALDPFAVARAMAGGPQGLIRRVEVPPLPVGRAAISILANLPEPVAGLLALFADLRFAPTPQRPQVVTAGAALDQPERAATVTVPLAPGERPAGEVRLRAVVDSALGPQELDGPWRAATGGQLLLGPDAFPVPVTVLRASPGLVAVAVVEVRRPGGAAVIARLDRTTPAVTLPRLPGEDPPRLLVLPLGPGRPVDLPVDDARRLDLDPATLPGFGAHRARFTARLAPGAAPLDIAWHPEGGTDPPASVRLTADRPTADVGWVATSAFQPGLVWGISRNGTVASWSQPVPPAAELIIEVIGAAPPPDDPPLLVNGVELRRDPVDPTAWTYVPAGPLLETAPDGRAAIGLVEAGDVAFLQLTTRIDGPEPARAALLAGLRTRVGDGPRTVRPLPVVVRRVALQIAQPDGAWVDVAAGGSSGVPPWITALSAMLTAEQLVAVRAALGGERGRARLLGELEIPGRAAGRSTAASVTTTTTTTGRSETTSATRTESTAPQRGRTVEQIHDVAELIAAPAKPS